MSRHMWFIIVKRNIARLVPSMKNASEAAREVMKPAVAAAGMPWIDDCVVGVSAVNRFTALVSAFS